MHTNVTNGNITSDSPTQAIRISDLPMYTISLEVHKYGILAIALFGTVGNIFSILVFSRPYFSGATTSIFLRFLAVFDTITLLSYIVWDATYYFWPEVTSENFCRTLFWIMAAAPHVASYILLSVTIERLVAVVHPLYVRVFFTRMRVIVISCVVSFIPFTYNLAYFYIGTVHMVPGERKVCRYHPNLKDLVDTWYYFDAIIGILIPAVLILILNLITITAYNRARQRRKRLTFKTHKNQINQEKEKGQHLTVMLMAVSLAYWVLMLPNAVLYIVKIYWKYDTSVQSEALFYLIYCVSYLLMITTNAIQFVLYVLTATKFAQELRDMLTCARIPVPENTYSMSTNAANM